MVPARILDALFEQRTMELKALGATQSDLINAAFEYVLREKALPAAPTSKETVRSLSPEKKAELAQALNACTLDISVSADVAEDKAAIRSERAKRYEALA